MKIIALTLAIVCLGLASCEIPRAPLGALTSDPSAEAQESEQPMADPGDSLASLVQRSPLIFLGTVSAQEVEKDQRGLIVTHNDFRIDEVLLGESEAPTITLTILGGTLGDETLRVSHLPVFTLGQQYIIFTDPNRTTYDPVTGNTQGVFRVDPNDSSVYTYEGYRVLSVEEGLLQLGQQVVFEPSALESQVIGVQPQSPTVEGDIVAMEAAASPTEDADQVTLSVEQFSAHLRQLDGQQ